MKQTQSCPSRIKNSSKVEAKTIQLLRYQPKPDTETEAAAVEAEAAAVEAEAAADAKN